MDHHSNSIQSDILVVGAGISGMTTALEAAETGFNVIMIEKNPYIGGRVPQLNMYFPKLCPPTCGLEINVKRLKNNPNIELYTQTEVESVEGEAGNYTVKLKLTPRFVTNACTLCGECEPVCPELRKNDFNFGLDETKAIYMPYNNSFPQKYVIDGKACPGESCGACKEACKFDAIDFNQKVETLEVNVKTIVWATGWNPYDAKNLENLGFGKYDGVINNMMMERLAAPNGPTGGKIQIPGSDKELKKVVFVQCAGSRDENHLEFCSSICCLASMKHARYVREQYPDAEIHIFYIDIRTPGMFEDFYAETKKDEKLFFHRGKAAKVIQDPVTKELIVEAEDTLAGGLNQATADLVVLATGMQPTTSLNGFPDKSILDENGFVRTDVSDNIIGCGTCTSPNDVASVVQESTAAAMKAVHIIKGGK